MRNLRNSKGFTLIELMIVVVIIGILAAIAIPKFGAASDRAKEKEADGILKQMYTLQSAYFAQHGEYATNFIPDLQSVGWEPPTNLQNYTMPATPGTTAGGTVCLTKDPVATATHDTRCIDMATGAISVQ
jgi:prepilin-type N-terminal cleavage/methylation domain-containing protein